MADRLDPIPPGEILLEEYMEPLNVNQRKLASDLDIPISRVSDIVHGKRGITADTALRLGEYFGTEPQFWLNLQATYDLQVAQDKDWPNIKARIRPLGLSTGGAMA